MDLLNLIISLIFFCLLIGLFSYCVIRRHVLISLISLEFIRIILFLILVDCYCLMVLDSFVFLFYLVFSACEGAFGLGVIIYMVRGYGNDLFRRMRLMKC